MSKPERGRIAKPDGVAEDLLGSCAQAGCYLVLLIAGFVAVIAFVKFVWNVV